MNKQEVLQKLEILFHELFGDQVHFDESVTSSDVRKWDSLHHVVFISRIEETFHIDFSFDEILDVRTIGDICSLILSKG